MDGLCASLVIGTYVEREMLNPIVTEWKDAWADAIVSLSEKIERYCPAGWLVSGGGWAL